MFAHGYGFRHFTGDNNATFLPITSARKSNAICCIRPFIRLPYAHNKCARLNRGQAIEASLQKIWKSHSTPISTKIRLMKALVWPVATYGCESWTLRKNEETRLDAFEMKGLRKISRVSWTAKKTNEWFLNKAEVKMELL